jgi:large subunit ribosomal protein L18
MKQSQRQRLAQRHARIRTTVHGTSVCPRLSVSRSVAHIQAQLIDDEKGVTIFGFSDLNLAGKAGKATKMERAERVGEEIAKRAVAGGIKKAVFDRGGYRYHGRIAALAAGARKGGLEF